MSNFALTQKPGEKGKLVYETTLADRQSYAKLAALHKERTWMSMEGATVADAIEAYLKTVTPSTEKIYSCSFRMLAGRGYIDPSMSLQNFGFITHERVIDRIKRDKAWKEATKQSRAASYVSLSRWLNRASGGLLRAAIPNKDAGNATFRKIRDKVATMAMTKKQIDEFFVHLDASGNLRDATIARCALQGGKRVSECLTLKYSQVCVKEKTITFLQSKTAGFEKYTVITYPDHVFTAIKTLCPTRKGLVFRTLRGKQVSRGHFYQVCVRAGKKAKIPFRVTPHVLRTSCVTYLYEQGYNSAQIAKVTGHNSIQSVVMYDKSSLKDNPTVDVVLV